MLTFEAQGLPLAINFLNPNLILQGHYSGNSVQLWIKRFSSEMVLICRLWSHGVSAGEWGSVAASGAWLVEQVCRVRLLSLATASDVSDFYYCNGKDGGHFF